MKLTVNRGPANAKYLWMSVAVLHGDDDMPSDAPLRTGDIWEATIDLDTHTIENWPEGKTLVIDCVKVANKGSYKILDERRSVIVSSIGYYVPNHLLPGKGGDYLSLSVDERGRILNWMEDASLVDFEDELFGQVVQRRYPSDLDDDEEGW